MKNVESPFDIKFRPGYEFMLACELRAGDDVIGYGPLASHHINKGAVSVTRDRHAMADRWPATAIVQAKRKAT